MNVRRTFRTTLAFCLAAALPGTALWQIAHAAAPAHGAARQPLRALSARLHALLQPAAPAPAVAYSPSFHLSDYLPNSQPMISRGPSVLQPRVANTAPVQIVPFGNGDTVMITNAGGQRVRAPQYTAPGATPDTSITPNTPLTFTVQTSSAAQTTAVYLQFKDPDSIYQDTNSNGPMEHKVFTKDRYDLREFGGLGDSGSSASLFNGGRYYQTFPGFEEPAETFTDSKAHVNYYPEQRGVIGGYNGGAITGGFVAPADQNTINPVSQDGPNNTHPSLSGPDPGTIAFDNFGSGITSGVGGNDPGVFHSFGQEFECQYLNANPGGSTAGYGAGQDAPAPDYGNPFYLAGFDDQQPNTQPTPRSEWLRLTRSASNPTQWSATWTSPLSPSDFYVDVVVYYNQTQNGATQNNWRIFDNIWGFSTQRFVGSNDILLVNDNALGQKFAASAALVNGVQLANLRPIYYGAESYYTDVDVRLLPNATYFYTQPSGKNPTLGPKMTNAGGTTTNGLYDQYPYPQISLLNNCIENGLGYGSYDQTFAFGRAYNSLQDTVTGRESVTETGPAQPFSGNPTNGSTVSVPKSQAYSIWRILSRGPVANALLTSTPAQGGYAPQGFASQPAVNDPGSGGNPGLTAPAADGTAAPLVPVAPRCVLWVSPFTGDQPLNIPGSLADTATQNQLTSFVKHGGRLFVSGQEVASTLTNNGNTAFLNNVLNASLVSDGNGSNNQTLTPQDGIGHFISFESLFDFRAPYGIDDVFDNFLTETAVANFYQDQASLPNILGNNLSAQTQDPGWRTDAALTELGPYVYTFGPSGGAGATSGAKVQSLINTVSPLNGAVADYSVGNAAGLVRHDNTTGNSNDGTNGYGSRVVFASFGMEGLTSDYYYYTVNSVNVYWVHNLRPNILHNLVSYLRTASFQGTITQGTGTQSGVAGATVYLTPLLGTPTIPVGTSQRQTFSATTSNGTGLHADGTPDVDASGNPNPIGYYRIDGVLPGAYRVTAYKTGFSRSQSLINNPTTGALVYTVNGDTTATVSLNIAPDVSPGNISGTVKFASGQAAPIGTPVTFTSTDGTTTRTATTTDSSGDYSATGVPTGVYNGTAATTSPAASATVSNIAVTQGGSVTANFVLQVTPGTVTGAVTDNASPANPLPGATVGFYLVTGGSTATTPTATVTTVANGTFPSPTSGLSPGTYTVTASKPGYVQTNTVTITVSAGQPTVAGTIIMRSAQTATLTGTVTNVSTGAAVPGASITIKDLAGNTVTTTPATVTTGGGGVYTETLLEGTYNVTVSAVSYTTTTQTVSVTAPSTTKNFQLTQATPLNSGSNAYTAGRYNLVSYPYEYDAGTSTPFDGIFGSEITGSNPNGNRGPALIYSASVNNYLAEPTAPADGAHLGRGYFVYLKSVAGVFSPLLGTPPSGTTVTVPLQSGWNMIGVPSTSAVSLARVQVRFSNGTTVSLASAATTTYNAVSSSVYGFNAGSGSAGAYYAVGSGGQMQPYQGYWVYAKVGGLSVVIPTTGG